MKPEISLDKVNVAFFESVVAELEKMAMNAAISAVSDGVGANRKMAEFMAQSRALVEDEAVQVIDAMKLAFDEKSERIRTLRSVTDQVSSEVAFMKTALNTVAIKTREIEALTDAINNLNSSMTTFKALVDDGTFDKAARAAAAMTPNVGNKAQP